MRGRSLLRVNAPVAALLDLVLPTPCAGCGAGSARLCAPCAGRFARPRRHAVAGLPPVVVLASYAGPARAVLLAYKERGRRDLARPLGAVVHAALRLAVPGPWCLVPAPSTAVAARARGGDHMLRLADAVRRAHAGPGGADEARGPAPPVAPPLVAPALALRRGAADSVGLDADARAANLRRHLRLRAAGVARARHALRTPRRRVVLLDDVLTTGATARAGVALLSDAGLPVDAVVVLTTVPGGPAGAGVSLCRRDPGDSIGSARRTTPSLVPDCSLTCPSSPAEANDGSREGPRTPRRPPGGDTDPPTGAAHPIPFGR